LLSELRILQDRILECKACGFVRSFNGESIPEHGLSPKWCWWFRNKYPCVNGRVKHYIFFDYNGSSNLVFVSLRPTTGWLPDTADVFLANALREFGLAAERYEAVGDTFIYYESSVLVTDLIKCRGKAKQKVEYIPEACLQFFVEELNIVRKYTGREPLIIAIGEKTRDLLFKYRLDLGFAWIRKEDIPVIPFHTTAWMKFGKKITRYEAYIEYRNRVAEALRRIGIIK